MTQNQAWTGGRLVEQCPNGVQVWQLTAGEGEHSNIYCELPYCSRDAGTIVVERDCATPVDGNTFEFVLIRLGSWNQEVLDVGYEGGIRATAVTADGMFYYLKRQPDGAMHLMCADLGSGQTQPVHRLRYDKRIHTLGTVSPGARHFALGVGLDHEYKDFGILLIDLHSHDETIIDTDPYIWNAHPQFEPGQGEQLMIQHNRGGFFAADGTIACSTGPEGATLYLLNAANGKRTELRVGKPYTTAITGHESWIGTSGDIVLSVAGGGDYGPEAKGNLLTVRAHTDAQPLTAGYRAGHVGVSRCGDLFSIDDYRPPYRVVIGSVHTGATAVVCEAKTAPTRSQRTHPHPYITPDRQWVIFNSNRGGNAQVYAARLTEELVDSVAGQPESRRRLG